MQYDVEAEFEQLRAVVEALEDAHPDPVVQGLVAPSSVVVSSGNWAPTLGKAVLRSVTLKLGSAELWVSLGEGNMNVSGISRPRIPNDARRGDRAGALRRARRMIATLVA